MEILTINLESHLLKYNLKVRNVNFMSIFHRTNIMCGQKHWSCIGLKKKYGHIWSSTKCEPLPQRVSNTLWFIVPFFFFIEIVNYLSTYPRSRFLKLKTSARSRVWLYNANWKLTLHAWSTSLLKSIYLTVHFDYILQSFKYTPRWLFFAYFIYSIGIVIYVLLV